VFEQDLKDLPCVEQKPIIYLSPEGSEPLMEVDKNAVYVIGGLVDRTIQSCKSFKRGQELGARVLRLPISECGSKVVRPERRVFNVNTVVEFLHYLASGKTGEEAFVLSIPKRWTLLN
jgi:tRNA (guanine9-N1)-methyltransferase